MRHTPFSRNTAAFYEFVDNNFLNNKRPPIPGGAWPMESLRVKSLADLQQIWFLLLKERNMLLSTKEHYLRHQEELGAMPSPSRIKMVQTSMRHIKEVVREREAAATAKATSTFTSRLDRGVYRFPPGPPPPPDAHKETITVKVTLSRRVEADRLREIFGRYDVFAAHKGIARVQLRLAPNVLEKKEEAERMWVAYMADRRDAEAYQRCAGKSVYDYAHIELAPGVWANDTIMDHSHANKETEKDEGKEKEDDGVVVASRLPVPPPLESPPAPRSPLERLRAERRSVLARTPIQLGYFPNITNTPPRFTNPDEVPRPTHPDELEGPWEALLVYDRRDGLTYAVSLGVQRIDGARVLGVEEEKTPPQPFAEVDPVYREARGMEMAREETLMQWPHVPEWKYEYSTFTRKSVSDIVSYNYSNVVDYVDREVLLTGRSVWECPIDIDYTCGGMKSVPAHAKKPKRYMEPGIAAVGVTDI